MEFKKKLLVVGVSTALGTLPMATMADMTAQVGTEAGIAVTADTGRPLTDQLLLLTEKVAGAVGAGNVVLALNNSAKFVRADIAANDGLGITTAMNDHAANADGKLVIPVTAGTDATGILRLTDIVIDTSESDVGDEIKVSLDSSTTSTGANFTAIKVATVEEPNVTIANADGAVPNFKSEGSGDILDINITENVAGAIATNADGDAEIVMTLPSGWTFGADSNVSSTGDPAITTDNPDETADEANTMTLNVTGGTANAKGSVVLGGTTNMTIKAPENASLGEKYAKVTVKLVGGGSVSEDIHIATVADPGMTATAVSYNEGAFDNSPTAIETDKLPASPANRKKVKLASVMVVERFAQDLKANDTLTLTLPTGLTFAADWTAVDANLTSSHETAANLNATTLTISDVGADALGGLLIKDIVVNIDSSVAIGNIEATLSGKVSGETIAPVTLTLGQVVEPTTTTKLKEDDDPVPTIGIGGTGSGMAAFTITETVGRALQTGTITLELSEGASWNEANAPVVAVTNGLAVNFNRTSAQTATLNITALSTQDGDPGVITVSGENVLDISAGYSPGPVTVSLGGTAGATTETLEIATAAIGTSTTVSGITILTTGTAAGQTIGTIKITEAFGGAIGGGKNFRLVLPSQMTWISTSPTVETTLEGATGTKLSDGASWGFSVSKTYVSEDTMVVTVPSASSTGATAISIKGLKVKVGRSASDGPVEIEILDGNTSDENGAGVIGTTVSVAQIGEVSTLTADPTTVTISGTGSAMVTVSGGLGSPMIKTAPDNAVATASLMNGELTITGVAEGSTTVVIADANATPQTVTISVTVEPAAELATDPADTVTVTEGETADITISGGTAPYTVASSDEEIATVTVTDNMATVTAVKAGEATITITDDADGSVELAVTVSAAVTPLPELTASTIGGAATKAMFYGGATNDDGANYIDSFAVSDAINVVGRIKVDDEDVDQQGEIYILAGFTDGNSPVVWFTREGEAAWQAWTGGDLPVAIGPKKLAEEESVVVAEGLKGIAGTFTIYMGYNLEGADINDLNFNSTPIEFTVE